MSTPSLAMYASFNYGEHHEDIIDVKQTAGANLKLVKNVWIHPSSAERQLWNAWISFCLIYNGVVIPVRIAFDLEEGAGAYAFDRCIDASFIRKLFPYLETGHYFTCSVLTLSSCSGRDGQFRDRYPPGQRRDG